MVNKGDDTSSQICSLPEVQPAARCLGPPKWGSVSLKCVCGCERTPPPPPFYLSCLFFSCSTAQKKPHKQSQTIIAACIVAPSMGGEGGGDHSTLPSARVGGGHQKKKKRREREGKREKLNPVAVQKKMKNQINKKARL